MKIVILQLLFHSILGWRVEKNIQLLLVIIGKSGFVYFLFGFN
jgi:hypothetical protein